MFVVPLANGRKFSVKPTNFHSIFVSFDPPMSMPRFNHTDYTTHWSLNNMQNNLSTRNAYSLDLLCLPLRAPFYIFSVTRWHQQRGHRVQIFSWRKFLCGLIAVHSTHTRIYILGSRHITDRQCKFFLQIMTGVITTGWTKELDMLFRLHQVNHWPLRDLNKIFDMFFPCNFSHWWPRFLLWNSPQVIVTGPDW